MVGSGFRATKPPDATTMRLCSCGSSLGIVTKLWVTRLRNRGSISGRGQICFCSAERAARLVGRPGLLFNGTHRQGMKLTTSLHLTPRLGMSGAVPLPSPHMPSCRAHGHQYLYCCITGVIVECSAFSVTVIWCCNCTVYFGSCFQIYTSIIVPSSLSLTYAPGLTKNAMPVSELKISCRPFTRRLDAPQSQFKPRWEKTVPFTRCQTPGIQHVIGQFPKMSWRVTHEHVHTIILKWRFQNGAAECDTRSYTIFALFSNYADNDFFFFYGYLFVQVGTAAYIRSCNMHKTICQPTDFVCLRARKQKYRYCSSIFNDSSTTRGEGGKKKEVWKAGVSDRRLWRL